MDATILEFIDSLDVLDVPLVLLCRSRDLFRLIHLNPANLQQDLEGPHPADAFQPLIILLCELKAQLV